MQSAIYLNNRASSLIEKDSFEKAIETLNQALNAVQKVQKDEWSSSSSSSSSVENSEKFPRRPGGKYLSTSNKRRKELDDLAVLMYSRPLYVSHLPQTEGKTFLSWIIIFNFALCHHLMALRAVDYNDKHENLLEALKLYEALVALPMEDTFQIETTYFMAMINNSAQIYQMLHRPRQAKQHADQMLSLLMVTIQEGKADTVDGFDGFLLNATQRPLGAVAA
ncbi:unnamed protein product [Cylindrotheca closterium]|uniref:Uncharacterized protein n=1 Tax=Cylindrotheca closterium TaxID=2856 RepID=A0AAD2FZ23_9STRA|nr:unnamed protein product [Cylindrotheca closterium]